MDFICAGGLSQGECTMAICKTH